MFVERIFKAGFSEASFLLLQWKYFRALNFLLFTHNIAISDSTMSFIREIPNLQSGISNGLKCFWIYLREELICYLLFLDSSEGPSALPH